jgi:mRNA interferase RelE/StbE
VVYRIEIKPAARKALAALPKTVGERLDEQIQTLAHNPRPPGCKVLKGKLKGLYRIRSGEFRIVYQIADDRLIVTIIKVGDRRDIYEPR